MPDREGRADSAPSVTLSRQLLEFAAEAGSADAFLEAVLPAVRTAAAADFVAVARGERGRWTVLASIGAAQPLPQPLLADCLDSDASVSSQDWFVAPLSPQSDDRDALVVCSAEGRAGEGVARRDEIAALLAHVLRDVRRRERQQQQIDRLQTLLQITSRWSQAQSTDELLRQIAVASTRLLRAERASIFLWDKAHRVLVGRPALGVDELRIPDDAGVVGQVVQSGELRRVDADEAQREVDRRVDRQLGFRTRNLLCVPLRAKKGGLFGAFEMINKQQGNFTRDDEVALTELAHHASIALEHTRQYEQLLRVRKQLTDQAAAGVQLIGRCTAIEALRSTIARIADTDLAILILGENGTGKEVVCQQIHYLSHRRDHPLVAVNCAALTETLLESELFGHEKGAFTDAREARAGKFELADGGTLFLDEIGEMSPGGQAKLLRVLEDKVVVRVGGSNPISVDTRVLAATNQNLARMVREKRFREDLFFRLNVVTLDLPPLRERGEDVLLLAEHFLEGFCLRARRRPPSFTAAAVKRLLAHPWPGNIRELRNLCERLAYLSEGDRVDASDLAFTLGSEPPDAGVLSLDLPLAAATRRFQTAYITRQIDQARRNMTDAAQRLGLHRSNLYRKMRQLGMQPDEPE